VPFDLDFKAIAATPITDVARALGFALTEKGDQLVGQCPISQTGNATVFKLTPSMNRFICFCSSCKQLPKQGGDCIELVRRFRRLDSHREAALEVQKLTNGAGKADDNPSPKQEASTPSKPSGFDPLKYLESLDAEHEALASLGLSPETLRAAKAGYASKGLNRGRLAVWCETAGVFVGVALKSEDPEYLVPKGKNMPVWFGCEYVSRGSEVTVVSSVLQVLQAKDNGCAAICSFAPIDWRGLNELADWLEVHECTVTW
jgi:hypothetical protein